MPRLAERARMRPLSRAQPVDLTLRRRQRGLHLRRSMHRNPTCPMHAPVHVACACYIDIMVVASDWLSCHGCTASSSTH